MKEDEAKTKWCPFARVCVLGPDDDSMIGFNRIQRNDEDVNEFQTNGPMRCIGSACMAWRWLDTPKDEPFTIKPSGYCGLAGKP